MALNRGSGNRFNPTIWPGFVDAMTGLLLVLMFVLTIFTVVQFVLRDEISGQATKLTELTAEVASLAQALGIEQVQTANLTADLGKATERATEQAGLIDRLTGERDTGALALVQAENRITGFEAQVAGLLADRTAAREQVAGLQAQQTNLMSEQDALNLALATARGEIDAGAEAARLAAARREALEALVAQLRTEGEASGAQISELEAARLVDAAAAEALQARLVNADTELTAMTLALEDQRRQAETTLTLLAAAESRRDELDLSLAAALLARQQAEAGLAEARATGADLDARLLATLSLQETTATDLTAAQAALVQSQTVGADLDARLLAAMSLQESTATELTAAQAALAEAQQGQVALSTRLAAAVAAQELAAGDKAAAEAALQTALQNSALTQQDVEARLAAALLAQQSTETERSDLQARLAGAILAQQDLEGQVAALTETTAQDRSTLEARLTEALAAMAAAQDAGAAQMTEAERQAALLATANTALSQEQALSADSQRQVALLNEQVASLRTQVGTLQALLDVSADADTQAQVQIEALGSQLNTALARAAAEERRRRLLEEHERIRLEAETVRLAAEAQNLERYRSEFFGRLRDVLDGQDGVRIEGDRFVFSSEVLFQPGSATLSPEGETEIGKVGAILQRVAGEIPDTIDWVIRVDGHTDNLPLSGGGEFRNNWELSQARALSVVLYMIDTQGISPNRLAANGFGEYQPVDTADTGAARAQNRRIEIKLTER